MQNDIVFDHLNETITSALSRFRFTTGQCVGLCAYISKNLKALGVENTVALGSLTCAGVKAFQYTKPIQQRPKTLVNWDGHAWIELSDGFVVEPSLLRTARAAPPSSNLRRHLENLDMLERGALLMYPEDRKVFELKYVRKAVLKENRYDEMIEGLIFLNGNTA